MKKTICFIIISVIAVSLCGCKTSNHNYYDYSSSTPTSSSYTSKTPIPTKAEILGTYSATGTKDNNPISDWKIFVKQTADKIYLQAYESGKEEITVPADQLERLDTFYNVQTGKFTQTYRTSDYSSRYQATFSFAEDGRLKIEITQKFIKKGVDNVITGLVATGYKD